MKHRTKTVIFIFLVIIFVVASPLAILYALGWRIDWTNLRPTQPGVIYLKAAPKNTQILVDGKLKKKTDFFFGSVLIENLLPKTYQIQISKDGFYSWQKNIEVKPRQVTEAKNVVLIPKDINFDSISNAALDFYPSPNGKKIIIKETDSKNGWALKLFEPDNKIKSQLISGADFITPKTPAAVKKSGTELLDLKFFNDSKTALLEVRLGEQIKHYLLNTGVSPAVLTELKFLNDKEDSLEPDPLDSKKIYILYQNKLTRENSTTGEIDSTLPLINNVLVFAVDGWSLYYLDDNGLIFKINVLTNEKEQLTNAPIKIKQESDYQIFAKKSYLLLSENQILYLLDPKLKTLEKVSDKTILGVLFSSDGKKLTFLSDSKIWILFLEKEYTQPAREAREKITLDSPANGVSDIFWFNDSYLIFGNQNTIEIAEIDNRDKINSYQISRPNLAKIFWDQNQKNLYSISRNTLYISSNIIR